MMMSSHTDYLRFTADEDGSTLQLTKVGTPYDITLQVRMNGGGWQNYVIGEEIALENAGDYVEFYGNNAFFSIGESNCYKFLMGGKIAASGNMMSVMGFSSICESSCYSYMFSGCTSLTAAPELPATTLASNCYSYMFSGCTSLTAAPELPATTLASYCYYFMFNGCTSLTAAPELPATTLAEGRCYGSMFKGCTSLTAVPALPATTLVSGCYYDMFSGCTNLDALEVNFTEWLGDATHYWLSGVKSTGTFTCPSALPQTRGTSNIPTNWTIITK